MASLLWYLALLSSTLALPASNPLDNANYCATYCPTSLTSRATTFPATDVDPGFNTQYRSTTEILWSCLAIIFASTWVCVHPNVAGHGTTKWQRLWKRVKLFALAMFAPELLAMFAFFQWRGCRHLHQDFRRKANALGISLDLNSGINPGSGGGARNEANGGGIDPAGSISLLGTTKRESWTTRLLALVPFKGDQKIEETAWTLTHAHFIQMGGIAFKGVRDDRVHCGFKNANNWKVGIPPSAHQKTCWNDEDIKKFFALGLSEAAISDKSKGSALAKTLVVMQVLWFVVQTIARAVEGLPITHLEVVCLAFTVFNFGMYMCWWSKPLDIGYPLEVPGVPGESETSYVESWGWTGVFRGGLDFLPVGDWVYSEETKLYPGLYCYSRETDNDSFLNWYFGNPGYHGTLGGSFIVALSLTSATFGAVHVLGWSLPSPSYTEHMLWRVSCIVLMSYPFLPLVISVFRTLLKRKGLRNSPTFLWPPLVFSFLGAVAYILARFVLLVLPFVELRDLPPLAHQTVSWANFLPHL